MATETTKSSAAALREVDLESYLAKHYINAAIHAELVIVTGDGCMAGVVQIPADIFDADGGVLAYFTGGCSLAHIGAKLPPADDDK
jgi:hypothetical protein